MRWQRIAPDVKLGCDVKIYDFVNLYGCEIGDGSQIGPFVEIQRSVVIGKQVKVQSHTFVCERVTIEDEVFIGHGVMFVNDKYPVSVLPAGTPLPERECTLVRRGASIGSNATILGKVTIGTGALVGAGSVVTHDVPDNAIVAGNPARVLRFREDATLMDTTDRYVTPAVSGLARQPQVYEIAKRVLDVTIALAALILFAPLWAMIAIAVRLTSPGPALYCQRQVVGKGGSEFTVYKFRTMHDNNNDTLHKHAIIRFLDGQPLDVADKNGTQVPVYKLTHDPRVTPLGRILRKTGLDEVPQFINVLRGTMSVVGPRPPLYYEYERYTQQQKRRLDVLPGITGLYQVTARSQVACQEMIEIDLEYIRRRSLWLDLKIMLLTPWMMITGKGAH